MNIIEKIKASIMYHCDVPVVYDDVSVVNIKADEITDVTAIVYLLKMAQQNSLNGQIPESANVAVFFVKPTTFDFNGIENEKLIQDCRQVCNKWLKGLRTDYHLSAKAPTETTRTYGEFDQILTGFAVKLEVTENYGFNLCTNENYLPSRTLAVVANGLYDIYGYTDLIVNCPQQSIVAYADVNENLHIDGLTIEDNSILIPSHDDNVSRGTMARNSENVPRGTIPKNGVQVFEQNGTFTLDGANVWADVEVASGESVFQFGNELHLPDLKVDENNNIIIDLRNE